MKRAGMHALWIGKSSNESASQNTVAGKDLAELFAARQRRARPILALDLREGGGEHLLLDLPGDADDAVGIAEYEIAGRDLDAAAGDRHVDRHDLAAALGVERADAA